MRGTICLMLLAGLMLALFGCGGGGYETSSGFSGMEVNLSGQYMVMSKDPGILPNLYSIQITQSGKSIKGLDNLGRTWTGTMSDLTYYGAYPTGAEADQQQQQQPGQQQQEEEPESFHGEIYMTMQTGAGTNTITGVVDTRVTVSLTSADQTGQQQATTMLSTVISGTAIDSTGNSGYINLYNSMGYEETATTTP
jgi:hypothetical protein